MWFESHSFSVTIMVCLQIITEWMQINFADPDIALLGITKITDVS